MQKRYDEDSSAGQKLLRLFRKLLTVKGKHTLSALAKELHCSPQTVIRLISEIENCVGDDLETGKEKNVRWYSLNSRTKNILNLDSNELRCLSLCRDMAEPYLTDEDKKRTDDTLLRISMMLADINNSSEKKYSYAFYYKGRIDYSAFIDQIQDLEYAIQKSLVCKLRYKKPNEEEISLIDFAPSQFICHNNALYILGTKTDNSLRQPVKQVSLVVHRILHVNITDIPVSFSLDKTDGTDFGLPWDQEAHKYELTLKKGRASNYVKERIWCENQKLQELENGDLHIEFISRSSYEVYAWFRSFGNQVVCVKVDDVVIDDLDERFI
ncbi:WYL domain-containing protein [Succinivibrio dextrinosolvens]|uniref:WYL domain-containing protein n=1 Tax=Succinivibrio dextrinosolvens TaxID=83771 RepID=UPI00241F232F|nr:WYL domain-containing protein [Succinivibrio dextrinosolvens]